MVVGENPAIFPELVNATLDGQWHISRFVSLVFWLAEI
jgi:hypothetical protein